MAISHLCISCGWDLARVRARRDPHYGLPLVFCPQCHSPAARRRHPVHDRWRHLLRLKSTLLALVLQLAAASFFVPMVMAVCIELGRELSRGRFGHFTTDEQVLIAAMVAVLAIALGAWLTAGFRHWRRWIAWLVFTALVAVAVSADGVIAPAIERLAHTGHPGAHYQSYEWSAFGVRLALLAAIMIIALAGLPLGHLILSLHGRFRRWRWRARRSRLRARRFAG